MLHLPGVRPIYYAFSRERCVLSAESALVLPPSKELLAAEEKPVIGEHGDVIALDGRRYEVRPAREIPLDRKRLAESLAFQARCDELAAGDYLFAGRGLEGYTFTSPEARLGVQVVNNALQELYSSFRIPPEALAVSRANESFWQSSVRPRITGQYLETQLQRCIDAMASQPPRPTGYISLGLFRRAVQAFQGPKQTLPRPELKLEQGWPLVVDAIADWAAEKRGLRPEPVKPKRKAPTLEEMAAFANASVEHQGSEEHRVECLAYGCSFPPTVAQFSQEPWTYDYGGPLPLAVIRPSYLLRGIAE